jgi:ATP-dependent RNA helicase DeaD
VAIRIKSSTATVATIEQHYWQVTGIHKLDALTRILEVSEIDAMIVFVRTRNETVELAQKLEARGYASAPLNGDMNQALREQTVEKLKSGMLDILVATDVAARGLDVERVSHVVNYDIPYDAEAYIHRIGRTGRAGRAGTAILFVAPREKRMLQAIEKATRQPISPMHLPTRAAVADKRVTRLKQLITETLQGEDLGFFRELVASYLSEQEAAPEDVAAALVFLLQRDRPLVPPGEESSPMARHEGKPGEARARQMPDAQHRDAPAMERYRIEVGTAHGVRPNNIVGAIANEAELESRYIGQIRLFDTYSLVELPEGMPGEVFRHLRSVWVCGRQLRISRVGEANAETQGVPESVSHKARKASRRHAGGRKAVSTASRGKAGRRSG